MARHMVPFSICLILLLITILPMRIPALAGISPMLTMVAVYYWAIYRPDLLPAWAAFVLGLLSDIVIGHPLGMDALVLLLVQGIAANQRKFFLGKSFLVAWWAFGLLAAGAMALSWLVVAMMHKQMLDPTSAFFAYILTMGLFPLLTRLLAKTQVTFLKDV